MRNLKSLRFVLLIALVVMAFAPAYAQDDEGKVVIPAGSAIKMALVTDLTGPIAQMGLDIANSGELAIAEVNEAGGVKGFPIELLVEDDRCDSKEGTTVANRVASNPEIVAVIGHICSGPTIAASDVYEEARIPMMSPSATNATLTSRGSTVFNRVAFSDYAQGQTDAHYMYKVMGARTLAVLHDNAAYGQGIAEVVQKEFEGLGGEVVAFQGISVDDTDYRAVLTPLASEPPDALFFGGYQQQAVLLITQMNDVGLGDTVFFSDDGSYAPALIEGAGDAAEGIYASFAIPAAGSEEATTAFDEKYEEMFDVAPADLGPFHYHTYDSAMMLIQTIDAASEVDADGNLVIDREALIAGIREIADYPGLTGTLTCSETGECGSFTIGINMVEDGEWVSVEVPEDLLTMEAE